MGRRKRSRDSGSRYVYLGKRVKDVGRKGLDSPSEFRGILREIKKDVKTGRIDKDTARGRLLLLYRLTFPSKNSKVRNISPRTRLELRAQIRKVMSSLKEEYGKKLRKKMRRD